MVVPSREVTVSMDALLCVRGSVDPFMGWSEPAAGARQDAARSAKLHGGTKLIFTLEL